MKKITMILLIVLCSFVTLSAQEFSLRPVHTYSIVARDSVTGDLGVAVQSHWFSVGSVVTWAEAGVGAVATQSFVEVSYGPLGLELMRAGKTAQQALQALLAVDPQANVRQVAMVDIHGNVATYTGDKCIQAAGHHVGKQYSAQANLMLKNTVWDAMAKAYETAAGDLINRLLAALQAAQQEGGDIRGKQSAAILVVPGRSQGAPWREKIIDLRVEDHPEPLAELKRLIRVQRAYDHMNKGDEFFAKGDIKSALAEYSTARTFYPDNLEIIFWQAVTMANTGSVEAALPLFREVFAQDKNWLELTSRLPQAGQLPSDPDLLQRILQAAKK